jgi:tetratricopeptide (TPR) repeat protein
MAESDTLNRRRAFALGLLLACATLAVYWQVGRFEFINFDDPDYVANNRYVQMGLTAESVKWAFTNPFAWHPVTWLSHLLDGQLFGVNAGAFHRVNALFHAANTVLLFLALWRLTGAEGRSAFVAALFALHPLHVESVAWVAERKDVLSGFFWLLTLLAYAGYARQPGVGRYLLALLCFALGLMSKPMVVSLPMVLLLLDYWPLGRLQRLSLRREKPRASLESASPAAERGTRGTRPSEPETRNSTVRLLLEKIPFLALSLVVSAITLLYRQQWGKLDMEMYSFPVRLANALVACVRYLGKTLLPENLAVMYPHPGGWPVGIVIGAGLLLGVISVTAFVAARRLPYVLVGWLWFIVTLIPVLGLVQVTPESMADRYTYLPLIGLFIAATWGAADLAARWPKPRLVLAGVGALVMVVCLVGTWRQLQHWRNSITLFSQAVEVTSDNARARYNLAQALSILSQNTAAQGQAAEAKALLEASIPHYEEVLRLRPTFHEAHNNLGLTLATLGRIQEATNHYAEALRLAPKNDVAHYNYANALAALGQFEAAVGHFQMALQLDPGNPLVHYGLARVFELQGRASDAITNYQEAVRVHPKYAEARYGLGHLLLAQGQVDDALPHLTEAVRLQPRASDAHAKLGMALAARGRVPEALSHYREALRLKPDYLEVLNNLAWLLATHPQSEIRGGTEAVQLARRACELTQRKQPFLLGTLAAAYAEAGQFDQAVAAAQEAVTLAGTLGQTNLVERNQQLLELYRARRPYREQP